MSSPLSGAKNPKIKKQTNKKLHPNKKTEKNTTKINPQTKKKKEKEKKSSRTTSQTTTKHQNITKQEESNKILQITASPINTLQNENRSHGSNNPDGNQSMMLSAEHHL